MDNVVGTTWEDGMRASGDGFYGRSFIRHVRSDESASLRDEEYD